MNYETYGVIAAMPRGGHLDIETSEYRTLAAAMTDYHDAIERGALAVTVERPDGLVLVEYDASAPLLD